MYKQYEAFMMLTTSLKNHRTDEYLGAFAFFF